MSALSVEGLESVSRRGFQRVFRKAFARLKHQAPVSWQEVINERNAHGCSLLHYVAALDYFELIELFHEFGADLNIKTERCGITPLIVAAVHGHEVWGLGATFIENAQETDIFWSWAPCFCNGIF